MKKQLNNSGFHLVMIPFLIIVVGIIGFAGWYVYQSQHKTNNTLGEIAQSQLDKAATTVVNIKATATPTPTGAKNELDTLREFCQGTDLNAVVGNIIYAETVDGKFASCGVGPKNGGGATIISYIVDGKWTKITTTQMVLPSTMCTQYKLPSVIGFCYENQ